jgi:uncharacterized iron-regulated protein
MIQKKVLIVFFHFPELYYRFCGQLIFFVFIMLNFNNAGAQDKPAFRIFSKDGAEVYYNEMFNSVGKSEVIFFGEIHNNPIAHWLELELFKDLISNNKELTLAMEMLEADDQLILNEYLSGKIDENNFIKEAKLWDNYKTDYRPLIEVAKRYNIHVIASNIPRRYANMVYRKGLEALDSLTDEAKNYITPLPLHVDLQLSNYKNLLQSMGDHVKGNGQNFVNSQAIKDATMAYFLLKESANQTMHINGAYHSQKGEGIIWYLRQQNPDLRISSIETVEQEEIGMLEKQHYGKADFLICIPSSMTKTFYSR